MKPKMMSETRLMTGKFRVSFPAVFEPKAFEGQEPKYSLTMLFDQDDETIKVMKSMAAAAMKAKWGDKKPANFNSPFHKGDDKDYDGYAGKIYVKAASKNRPGVIGPKNQVLKDGNEFYPGCWARATVAVAAWEKFGKTGVSFYLGNVQKLADDDAFDGRKSAEDEFEPVASDADDSTFDTAGDADDVF